MKVYRFINFIWLFLIFLLGSFATLQAEEITQEYQLKAAFLVNFARFLTWPEQTLSSNQQEFTICVAGVNPFGNALQAAESKQVHGRKIRVNYVESLRDVTRCNLLFISRSEEKDLGSLSSGISQLPVVTVSDIPGFVKAGGSIEFIPKENRLSFIINNSALKQAGILASASMLDLAASVR